MKQILLFAIMFFSPMVGEAQGVSKLVGHLYYDGLSYVGWINYDSMEDCDNNRNGKAYVYVHNSSAIDYYNYDENIPSGHLVIRNSVTFENISWLTSDITFPVVEISLICKKNITSVTIPKSVKIIGGGGFLDCPNLKYAFFLALAKYLYKDKYTFMGILNKIPDLMQQKKYIKIVKEGMKLFREQQKEKEELEKKEKRNKEIQKNHYLKNQKRKKAQKEKENNILKETIKEAINESK